ncbi:hypothetical protein EDB86DRAFT_3107345 [Lactarius hatsudake]|nr:hypothetical protein EDB86DRAFT_3107345 [Lactarius hatsudake]
MAIALEAVAFVVVAHAAIMLAATVLTAVVLGLAVVALAVGLGLAVALAVDGLAAIAVTIVAFAAAVLAPVALAAGTEVSVMLAAVTLVALYSSGAQANAFLVFSIHLWQDTGCGMDQYGQQIACDGGNSLPAAYHIVLQRELEESQGGFLYRDQPELNCGGSPLMGALPIPGSLYSTMGVPFGSVGSVGSGLASSYSEHVGQYNTYGSPHKYDVGGLQVVNAYRMSYPGLSTPPTIITTKAAIPTVIPTITITTGDTAVASHDRY